MCFILYNRPYNNREEHQQSDDRPFERVLGDRAKEKLHFNRNKPPAEPG